MQLQEQLEICGFAHGLWLNDANRDGPTYSLAAMHIQ